VASNDTLILYAGMAEGWSIQKDLWMLKMDSKEGWQEIITRQEEKEVPLPLKDHTAAMDEGGQKMYLFGGKTLEKRGVDHMWVFHISEKKWYSVECGDTHPSKRFGHSMVTKGKKIYLFGGKRHNKDKDPLADLWEFDMDTNVWVEKVTKSESKPEGIVYHSAVVHKNQMILFGGYRNKKPCNELWTLNLENFEWTRLEDGPLSPRSGHAVALKGDSMLIFGGEGADSKGVTCENDMWVFNIEKKTWVEKKLAKSPEKRLGCKGVVVGNRFIVIGGIKVSPEWNSEAWFQDVWSLVVD